MMTTSPPEDSVTISRSDNPVAGFSPSSSASQLDSVTEGREETVRSCDSIGGMVEEANAFIVNIDEDNFNEAERDSTQDEHDESQYLLRNDRPRAILNKDYGTLNHNETVNKFLHDIYDKEIDLNLRFSDLEINDIRDAVKKLVNKLALKVGDVDERLKIADAILLGSAREGSQIVRPCEYDFALTLKYLSNADAVSLQAADTKDNSREYVHVNIKDRHTQTRFCELIDGKDARVLCSHWLPWYRKSLRGIFDRAIKTAVQSSKYEVIMDTGVLSLKNCKVTENGPAFTVRLIWERATHVGKTVDISVDLCPALKLAGVLDHVLPTGHGICPAYLDFARKTGSVLLMPREGFRFKVSFTEAELLRTECMSEHHKKGYTILKYIINGEPFPYEDSKNAVVEYFRGSQTVIHSYALKTLVWDHHYVQRCCEETDLGSCITQMLTKLHHSLFEGLVHPVHTGKIVRATMATVESLMVPTKSFPSTKRIEMLMEGLDKVSTLSPQDYSYKACSSFIATSGFLKCYSKLTKFSYFLFSFVMYIMIFSKLLPQASNLTFIIGSFMIGMSIATLWCPIYSKTRMLAFISMYSISEYRFSVVLVCCFSITHMTGWICFLILIGNGVVRILHVLMSLMLLFTGIFLMLNNIQSLRRHFRKGHWYVMLICTFMTFVGFIVYLISVISMPKPFWH